MSKKISEHLEDLSEVRPALAVVLTNADPVEFDEFRAAEAEDPSDGEWVCELIDTEGGGEGYVLTPLDSQGYRINGDRQLMILDSNSYKKMLVEQYTGRPLSDLPFDNWDQHWPVIDTDLNLTGEYVDSDTPGWHNYRDLAAIWDTDAITAGWQIDTDPVTDDGYVYPKETQTNA